MSVIYEPKGKAREYSPLAVNFYNGCDHGCSYCYVPKLKGITMEKYLSAGPRGKILQELEKDAKRLSYSKKQVLFNFVGDPYCKAEQQYEITRSALEIMLKYHIPVAILTKGGLRALRDKDIILKYKDHIKVGATLTFDNDKDSKTWEPGAASPQERMHMLKQYHDIGVKTWASFEPVISPRQSLSLIQQTLDFVYEYKIGKINNYHDIDKNINWNEFLAKAVKVLREAKKRFYVKYDLRIAAPSVKLYGDETKEDSFGVKPWDLEELFKEVL